ncbi:MAG TPA: hypothetical protein PLA68_13855 [Panacibacter sp.]|nr:hypothetical protein [Panacibacter sp.]
MKEQYLKFFKKVIILLVIMFIVDRGLGSIIEYYFQNEPLGDDAAFSHAINDPQEDILIYGSSRAVHTYDPKIFTDTLGVSCYNCGRNSSNVIYHSAILPAALEGSHKPKAIIIDLFAKEIAYRSGQAGNDILAGMILPYVLTNQHFAQLAEEVCPNELKKAKVSKLYAYNSLILSIISNYSRSDNDNINGYQPLRGSKIKGEPDVFTSGRDGIDNYAKEKLEFFIKTVTEAKIPLIVIISPMYVKPFQDNESLQVTKEILRKYNVDFWDYTTDTAYVKQSLFYDMNHMNTKGAEKFSAEIASRIKQMGIIKK